MDFKIRVTPLSERVELISQRIEAATTTQKLYDFRGGMTDLPVIKLDVKMLVYRMDNCRTFSEQQNEIATNDLAQDFFEKGQEVTSVQKVQHGILARHAIKSTKSISSISKTLDSDGQREPLLITSSGVVVNGNRRLSAMRELNAQSDGSQFSHIECFVLPSDTTPDEIDDIEATLQARPETKMAYDRIGEAQLVRRQVGKGRTHTEVAKQLRRTPADIKNYLASLDEADLYLSSWLGKPGQYAIIGEDAEQIFSDIPKKISNKEPDLENASRAIAWTLFENRDKLPGRLYSFNEAFGSLAERVITDTAESLGIDLESKIETDAGDDDEFDVDFGDDINPINYSLVVDALKDQDRKDEAIDVLIDACESAIEAGKAKDTERAALKALTSANSKISGIEMELAGESTLPGILKQIESIRKNLDRIEINISKRKTASTKN